MSELTEREYRQIEGNLLEQINNLQKDLIDAMVMLIKGTLYRNMSDEDIQSLRKFVDTVSIFKISFEEGILKINIPEVGMKFLYSKKYIETNFKDENLNEVLELLDRIRDALKKFALEVDAKQQILKEECCYKLEVFEQLKRAIIEYSKI